MNQQFESVQIPMNFNSNAENRFRDRMDNAVFSLLIETAPPNSDADLASVLERSDWLRSFVTDSEPLPCALAFVQPDPNRISYDICEYASALLPSDRDRHLLYLSGRNRSAEDLLALSAHAQMEGFKNIVYVSGNPMVRNGSRVSEHTESVTALRNNAEQSVENQMFAGCVVNPFKYEISATCLQYFKLMKKINAGSGFAVAQAGWDMRKIQELRWYLFKHGSAIPLITRSLFLSPEHAENICMNRDPAIHISEDFRNALRDEMKYSYAQFEAAQWRRLQLQAAGAKLLGYSAIQLAGITRREQAVMAVSMISSAIREFTNMADWIEAYNEYYAQMDMIPYPDDFYLYEPLLRKGSDWSSAVVSSETIPPVSALEKLRWKCASVLLKDVDTEPPSSRKITKKILTSCRGCRKCRLKSAFFVCPETCFCGFANGVCGEITANGTCPYTQKTCTQIKRLRFANDQRDFQSIEETFID